MFSSSIWGQGQDILKPSFLGALNTNSQGSSDSVERKSDDHIVISDSIPTASEISLPLKSNNVLSMASVSSQAQNIAATPIFPREAVSVFPRKLNSISPLDNLRAVDNNKRSFDPQSTLQLTKPQLNSSLFSEGAGKQADLAPKSPFYPGNTTFGGASSVIGSYYPAPYSKTPIRRKVQAKHMSSVAKNNSKSLVTSSTAKRILETLENMSSPVTNAKKIPVYNDPGSLTFTPAAYSRRARSRYSLDNGPPVSSRISSKLNTTTDGTLSIDNLSDKPMTSNKVLSSEHTTLTTKPFSMDESALKNIDKTETIVQEPPSNSLKMKTKISAHAHYSAKPADSNPDYSLSTAVTLDIKALPKFDFKNSTAPLSEAEQQPKRKQDESSGNDTDSKKPKILPEVCEQKPVPSFESIFKDCQKTTVVKKPLPTPEPSATKDNTKFSFAPGVKPSNSLTNAVDVSLKEVGDFQFNRGISPIRASLSSSLRIRSVTKRKSDDANEKSTHSSDNLSNSSNIKSPYITSIEYIVSEVPSKPVSSPSVLPSKKSESTLESHQSLSVPTGKTQTSSINFGSKESSNTEKSSLNKDTETSCNTSIFSKDSNASSTEPVPLSALFKKKENTWNCSVCMVNNQDDLLNCASCSEPKPGTSKESSGFNPNTSIKFSSFLQSDDKKVSKTDEKTPSVVVNQAGGFKIAPFKPEEKKEKSVEERSEETSKEKPTEEKPSNTPAADTSLATLFKKTDVWRCPSCDIENKNDVTSCVCCGDSKPGSKNTDSNLKSDSGLKFSFLESSNKTDNSNTPAKSASTLVLNETGGFKFSASLPSTESSSLETSKKPEAPASNAISTAFGESSAKKSSSPFVFGQTSTATATPPTFVFGQQSTKPSESSGIAFGQPITSVSTSAFGQPSSATTSSSVPFLQSPISAASSSTFQFNVGGLKSTSSSSPALATISATSSAPKVTSTFSFGKPPAASTSESEISGGKKVDLFQFTGSGDSSTKSTSGFTFGKSPAPVNSSSTTKSEPFQFNTLPTSSLSSGPSFTPPTFGTPKAGGFEAPKSTTASVSASAPFTFGQTTSFGSDSNKFGGFNKGATTSASSNSFTFGSPATSASTFGGSNNPPANQFNFGAQQPLNQNNGGAGVFQFSAQTNNVNGVQQPSAPSNNQGFNFQAAPSTPSFNFGQQAPQNTSNFQFSGNAPPSNNNMNNLPSTLNPFSASPSVGGKRQIKKATRKLPRK
ncbi:DgyrCDS7012 [Dimorphilus gyrociliatus]|uniref:Nuclear pore complex protein Nup153 n=1 Tax=Dimorphilus gyrociliatus TaxID=2664684 RepID=A0A7I8VRD4_9ANNE|nr:DgyrCDS7012 [Dimorphilus gyrociliatus]